MTTTTDAHWYRTARLQLRHLQSGDEAAVYTLLSDLQVVRYTLFPIFTQERARQFVARVQAARTAQPLTDLVLGITPAEAQGDLMGLCGLVINPGFQSAEAWYLLAPAVWGRGFMTEAVRALLRIGFCEFDLHRIWATCLPENPASARVLEKVGFRHEGYQRQNLPIHGTWRDSHLYGLLEDEWKAAQDPPLGSTRPDP